MWRRKVGYRFAFDLRQVRIPAVHDQYHARLVAAIPGLVLHGVVKDPRLPLYPFPKLVSDPEGTVVGYNDAKMANQPRVDKAGVRWNACPGKEP